ncbi:anthranilate synthase component 2 [Neorhodopirellula lusitana]|uniref:Anthranilate synthase component 2 n=1 Tax=Neorhodopirellula lusitana TaxID=445327 RepID=A0ABY1PNX6_9BACT|nr:aminodeoxychorismate/anthranilate synthase component II [Neorhodopirellula lusitana]SMP40397.1 anthranilate synthase component 2 [Neorhodopirellula lusitana]
MILLLDNYDSFVHNIARYLRLGGKATRVVRSDSITPEQCWQLQPEAIVLSPGPHRPEAAGCCVEVVQQLAGEIPILGICLGHQAIAAAYGGVVEVTHPMHAFASRLKHDGTSVFAGLKPEFNVGRYHSLCVSEQGLPPSLQVTAWTKETPAGNEDRESGDGVEVASPRVVMGIADHARCVHGVQFHPESLLTENGHDLIRNFFAMVDRHHARRRRVCNAMVGNGRPVAWMSDSVRLGGDSETGDGWRGRPPLSVSLPKQRSPGLSPGVSAAVSSGGQSEPGQVEVRAGTEENRNDDS